ncbi:MAG: hypothetical protein Q9226_008736 [Calogaya cf. arnoldii]
MAENSSPTNPSIDETMSTKPATRGDDPNKTSSKASHTTPTSVYVVWSSESSRERTQPTELPEVKTVTKQLSAAPTQEDANEMLQGWFENKVDNNSSYKVVNGKPDSDGNAQCMLVGREPGRSVMLHMMVAKVQFLGG